MKFSKLNRDIHRWGSIAVALPLVIVIVSGILLQLKKEFSWIQPATQQGADSRLSIRFDEILSVAQTVPEAEIQSWSDIDRLDVRPNKGIVKVRAKNRWELQVDTSTCDILQVAYRRSDLIESLHDGSFFHERVKLWVFLPAGLMLGVLWGTGIYLFLLPFLAKRKRKRQLADKSRIDSS